MFPSIKSNLCSSILIIVTLVLANGSHLILATNRAIPTKADCVDLWNVVNGPGSGAMDSLRKVHGKGIASDATTILRLYEDCLRAEEGIRYRRSGPSFMTMEQQHQDQNGQLDNFDSFNIQDDAKLSNKRILYRLKQLFNRL